ncbi:MAG: Nif3-like dinuclear metal center hexameric protein [Candidatus Solibacter sp.]
MKPTHISRRQFAALAGTVAAASLPMRSATPPTAQAVVDKLQAALGGEWPATGVEGFKAGDPNSPVKGIATTAMATMEVLKQAVKANANLVITYEPTFFGRADGPPKPAPAPPAGAAPGRGGRGGGGFGGISPDDPVYKGKKEFIEKNGLVVYRLFDHWKSRKEGEMVTGLADALGWSKGRVKPDDVLYEIPSASYEDLVAQIKKKLNLNGGLRAVGDRKSTIRKVMLCPGTMAPDLIYRRYAEADLMIAGEVREWENTFFAADIVAAGEKHGLITLGRVASEDPGMRACAAWLKTVVKDVPAQFIAAGDLYWRAV